MQVPDIQNPALERRRNVRLGLILASVALTFFGGFIVKIVFLSHH